jgi:hypothetical protein
LTNRRGQTLCIISFVVSRLFYLGLLGLSFDESSLIDFLQYVDVPLLKNHLWESLYYLHSQPPGFNLFLGVVLQAFPESHALVFRMVFIGLGLLLTLSLFTLMVRLGVSAGISAALTILFSASPTVVLYESWLYYGYPAAALLCFAAVLLHRFAVRKELYVGLAFFSVLTLMAYIWPLFHLIWFVFFCLVILYILRADAKNVALAACLPLLAVGALCAKNYVVFGSFTTGGDVITSIQGLKATTYYEIPEDEHRSLIEQGKLTPMSLIPRSSIGNVETYTDMIGAPPKTGVAVLDQVRKANGESNFNYVGLLKVAKLVSQDNRYFLRTRPDVYLRHVFQNCKLYFLPASDGWMFQDWRFKDPKGRRPAGIQRLDHLYNLMLLGQRWPSAPAYFLVVGLPVLLAFGCYAGAKASRGKDLASFITLFFLVANILYVTLAMMVFGEEDFNRYRFTVDAFYVTLLGLLISSASPGVKTMWRKRIAHRSKEIDADDSAILERPLRRSPKRIDHSGYQGIGDVRNSWRLQSDW